MSVREGLDQLVSGRKAVLRGSQTWSRLTPSFSLAKLLDHLPKASPQGLFPYLATASLLRQHTKVQQSRIIKWLLAKASNQDLPTHPDTDSPLFLSPKRLTPAKTSVVCPGPTQSSPSPFWASERRVMFREWAEHQQASSLLPDCGSNRTTRCLLFLLSSHSHSEELDPQTVSQNKTSSLAASYIRLYHRNEKSNWFNTESKELHYAGFISLDFLGNV